MEVSKGQRSATLHELRFQVSTKDVFETHFPVFPAFCMMEQIHGIQTNAADHAICVVAGLSLTLCNCDLKPFSTLSF